MAGNPEHSVFIGTAEREGLTSLRTRRMKVSNLGLYVSGKRKLHLLVFAHILYTLVLALCQQSHSDQRKALPSL